ncbi:MAG: AAA family ATPase [Bacillota bacterium]
MNNLFEIVKRDVKIYDVINKFVAEPNSQGKVICPFHMEKTPSLSVNTETNSWKCFGCGKGGDAIDFVCELKGISNIEAAEMLADIYGISYEKKGETKVKKQKASIKKYISNCKENIGMTDYFGKRGLTKNTIAQFSLGFDKEKNAVVIPYSSKLGYYQRRSVADKRFYKPKTEDAGAEPLWGAEALNQTKKPIFVVESPICAMSISQCGGIAVSICGATGGRKLLDNIKKAKEYAGFILCFDNDEPGKKASRELARELYDIGAKFIEANVAAEFKDPNELLVAKQSKLKSNIVLAGKMLKAKYKTDKDSFTASDLFHEEIPPTEWIIDDILPTGLAFLCAPSKFGKSWMVLQMCLSITKGETFFGKKTLACETLYYALEDGKARLQDRLVKIQKGKEPPATMHFSIKADMLDNGLLSKIEEELEEHPNIKLVIIDTLQKVRGKSSKSETLYSNDYREMGQIKEFADKHKICILLVHHLRKMADEADVFNMISGSTALMGAADTIMIISKKKRNEESAKFSATGRDIEQKNLIISFDRSKYCWRVDGTAEEVTAAREQEEYENNLYIKTIKELVAQNPMTGWTGSVADLLKAVYDVTDKQVVDSVQAVGKLISRYDYKLHCDDIEHKATKSGTRSHTFKRIVRDDMRKYQYTFYDKNDD